MRQQCLATLFDPSDAPTTLNSLVVIQTYRSFIRLKYIKLRQSEPSRLIELSLSSSCSLLRSSSSDTSHPNLIIMKFFSLIPLAFAMVGALALAHPVVGLPSPLFIAQS